MQHDVRRLEGELAVRAADLDPDDEAVEAAAQAHSLEVRRRAAGIVAEAAKGVLQSVMPGTLAYMRTLLPAVTAQRYFDVRLADDYLIEVWDEAGAAWRKKNIFSGGTRDQMSLALRIAFALATLPEERGSAPGFLFLDEPLAGFDPERARALVELLTAGVVAESFDQIFLISHVPVDTHLFDAVIELQEGRVVAATEGPADGVPTAPALNP
jgi:exonuclease SbcC